jgi:hypothetical protein
MMFAKDSFIRWTGNDSDGEFSYTGQVKMVHDETVIFEDSDGVMYGVHKDDGEFESISKPKNWNRPKSVMTVVKTEPKKEIKSISAGGSKFDQVVELLRANPALINSRKQAIEAIVAAGISTSAGASTHFNNAKKVVV